MLFRILRTFLATVTALAFISIPLITAAESVISTSQVQGSLVAGYMESSNNTWLPFLGNPLIQARYGAGAVTPSGQNICGAIIPTGSRITITFAPDDLTWNATGGAMDTPAGYWLPKAGTGFPLCSDADQNGAESTKAWGSIQYYTPFSANPPSRSISGSAISNILTCSTLTPDANGQISCTASHAGQSDLQFDFSSTYGKFYFHTKASAHTSSTCAGKLGSSWFGLGLVSPSEPMRLLVATDRGNISYGDRGYTLDDGIGKDRLRKWSWMRTSAYTPGALDVWVGANAPLSYDVSIPDATISCPITVVDPNPTTTPVVRYITSASACIIGQPLAISMTATSPNRHQIRYGIDWANTGVVNQYLPSSGYVSSGTAQSASRTYITPGPHSVKVVAQDDTGATSNRATYTFSCAKAGNSCPAGQIFFRGACVPSGHCSPHYYCAGSDIIEQAPDCTKSLVQHCALCNSGACVAPPLPSLDISASPRLVRAGTISKITWSSKGTKSCTVSANNGDGGTSVWNVLAGTQSSSPILQRTIYTLACLDANGSPLTKSTTIDLIPSFEEK